MVSDRLFSPFTLKNVTLRNRLGVAPMTRMSSPGDSIPRQDVLDFLVRRAAPLRGDCREVFRRG
jgi:2,4-dienoyl-CoA reductase-like NADH-dependent reductase (Old Yellow Enzyme family)